MRESGMSMVAVMVAVGIAGILAVGVNQLTHHGAMGAKAAALAQDLEVMKGTIRARLDCRKTFGIAPATPLPVACSGAVAMKDRNGVALAPAGKIGVWSVSATCVGREVIVSATKGGKDPLTGQAWSSRPTASDLFMGTSDFCREYLDPAFSACTGAYDIYQGRNSDGPVCCRQLSMVDTTGPIYRSQLSCAANEYLLTGGGSCHQLETGYVHPPTVETFMHTNYGDFAANKWIVDCDRTDVAGDVYSYAMAICCPRN